jgi:hypothetical protein
MSKEKAESTQDFTADFARELSELQSAIATVRAEFGEILEAIVEAKEAKEQAKRDYDSSLDAGNQEAMTSCLGTIRKSNDAVAHLEAELPAFLPRAADLRNRQSKLWDGVQAEKLKAETTLRQTRESLAIADTQVAQARGLSTSLNNLDSFLRGEAERSM